MTCMIFPTPLQHSPLICSHPCSLITQNHWSVLHHASSQIHFISLVLTCLFLIHLFHTSLHLLHPHHSHHPSLHHSHSWLKTFLSLYRFLPDWLNGYWTSSRFLMLITLFQYFFLVFPLLVNISFYVLVLPFPLPLLIAGLFIVFVYLGVSIARPRLCQTKHIYSLTHLVTSQGSATLTAYRQDL